MECEVKTLSTISDFKKIQEFFGLTYEENWFSAINYAISPTGELIALAQGEKLALLSSSWDNRRQLSTYTLSWRGELEDPNQIVTSVLCLPFHGKTVSSGPEWTCVALGLSSGMVVFYTDTGIKIFSQSFYEESVLSIKCYTSARYSELDAFVYIVYDQCVCIIRGTDIFPLLTQLHHNVSHTIAHNAVKSTNIRLAKTTDNIQFYKFKFIRERETMVNDVVVVGGQPMRTFDHLVEQSLTCGYYAKVLESPVQRSVVVAAGAEPYLGFYYAEEGYKTMSLGEVAKDVIGIAYKNLMGNLFRRAPEQNPQGPEAFSKEAEMRTRCRLYDGKRDGFNVVIAPNGRLAAVTDNLDRVMLVDVQRAIVLRIWKGYRDAQCGFMPITEKTLKGIKHPPKRKTLFLVIYAPRLGCLEIWALQHGPRVAAFTVSKNGQLAYNTHGLLNIQPGAKVRTTRNCCLFLDANDASVKEIQIPFHLALSETNSHTSRDIHLLRRLKSLLRDGDNYQEIAQLAREFQTVEVRQQCIAILCKNKQIRPEIFQTILSAFADTLADEQNNSDEHKNFQIVVGNYNRLVNFYIAMQFPERSEFDEHLELQDSDLVIINKLVLLLGKNKNLLSALNTNSSTPAKVKFQDENKEYGDFVDYLSIFNVNDLESVSLQQTKSDLIGDVSGKLFSKFFGCGLCFEQFKREAEKLKIPYEDLMVLALLFWIEKPFEYQNCDEVMADMSRLAAMIRTICEMAGDSVNDYAYNAISPWWQNVREMLLESPKPLSLLVAIVCKTEAGSLRRSFREGSCDEGSATEDDDKWERISQDEAEWVLLISKLEDISILAAILEYPIFSEEPMMPKLPYERPVCSLKFIFSGGKGIVTDLAAQWLINSGIHPSKILEEIPQQPASDQQQNSAATELQTQKSTKDDETGELLENAEPTEEVETDSLDKEAVMQRLALLRDHFPFSLESGVLLTLMSWQYMVHWSKHLQSLEYMRAALTCLTSFKTEDFALKHGICCLIWIATLKYPLQCTLKLIQKAGHLPRNDICQQDIEMGSACVSDFLELSLEFLQHFSVSVNHEKRELHFEESLAEGPLPVQYLALQQHHAIKELLELQIEVCTVLHFIAFFQLKIHQPLSTLFDAISNKAFFADINKELSFVLTSPDMVLQQHREKFLCKVISSSMELIREDFEQLYVVEHMQYMKKVCALADSWKLSKSALIRQQIVEMYAHSFDDQTKQLFRDLPADDEEIGRLLLEIAGRRISLCMESSQSAYMRVASVGILLLQYIDQLNARKEGCLQITATESSEVDLSHLAKLLTIAIQFLSNSKRDKRSLHVAAQMFDACRLLQEEQ